MTSGRASIEGIAERLEQCALRLFDERGYTDVTTAEIATAAGVTQRTFFRHFPSKADVVFGRTDDSTDAFINLLYAQHADLDVTAALVNAIGQQEGADPVGSDDVRRIRIIRATPELGDAARAYETNFEASLARWIGQRTRRDPDDFDVRVAAATLVAARRVVVEQWQAEDGATSVTDLARRAIGSITPVADHGAP